ncbi:hypothetical protein AYI70_g885 [Smittium culicis]|uniref:Uncharacterized protein n=1 Tax=Smittium culicis TaxID=133412 RepID=A0A1R1YET0_9FUNG|nr:hypothetical protein AYI70_g885 [Smittium culicis]
MIRPQTKSTKNTIVVYEVTFPSRSNPNRMHPDADTIKIIPKKSMLTILLFIDPGGFGRIIKKSTNTDAINNTGILIK